MRDYLIHLLGGYTEAEYEDMNADYEEVYEEMVMRGKTIEELQSLIPAPKKALGRPRKITPVKVV